MRCGCASICKRPFWNIGINRWPSYISCSSHLLGSTPFSCTFRRRISCLRPFYSVGTSTQIVNVSYPRLTFGGGSAGVSACAVRFEMVLATSLRYVSHRREKGSFRVFASPEGVWLDPSSSKANGATSRQAPQKRTASKPVSRYQYFVIASTSPGMSCCLASTFTPRPRARIVRE